MYCRCLIVDDEPPAVRVLKKYIESLENLELAGSCKNALEAMTLLNTEKIDLLFLDVNMPKLLGTQLVKSLANPPKVIFTSAHKEYAHEAFDLDAVDYLLKPISYERFLKAVNKFCQLSHTALETLPSDQGFVYFRSDRKMIKVYLDEIMYIESLKDYIVIHRLNKPDIRVKQTLSSVEELLPDNQFLRIHRSYIIALSKVTAFSKFEVEINNVELPFGKNYADTALRLTRLNQDV